MQKKTAIGLCALSLLAAAGLIGSPLSAQQAPAVAAQASGLAHTASGVPVPGAALRLLETTSGRAWISWTDENGRFSLPGLPPGHYRIAITQLGFEPSVKEFDLTAQGGTPVDLMLKVATLEAIEQSSQPAPPKQSAQGPAAPPAPTTGTTNNTEAAANQRASRATPNAGPGQYPRGGGGGARFAARQGAFQQLSLNGQQGQQAEQPDATGEEPEVAAAAGGEQGPLGQASASDAFLMNGTVGRGVDTSGEGGAFGGFAPNGDGGPRGDASNVGGAGPGLAGPGGPGGFGGPGGPGGGGAAPGLNLRVGGDGGGRQGPGGRPGPGGRGAPQGVPALFGLQRVLRQRANQIHASFYDQYSNSAFDARPYSLTEVNPAKIPAWNDRVGGNVGGPLRIPHIYDGSNRTFFFVNFESAWARNAVDQFSTVPTAFERQNPGDFCDIPGLQIYVPTNPAQPFGTRALASNGGCQIPTTLLNGTASGLLQFIPEPNVPGAGLVDNYHLQTRVPTQTNRLNLRILQTISPKLNAQFIYNFSQAASHGFQSFPSFESNQGTRGQSLTLGLTQNYSRRWINNSQLIFSRNRSRTLNTFANVDNVAGDLGITGVSTAPIDWGVPQLNFTNYTGLSDALPSLTRNQTYRFVDNVTNMRAKHTLTAGVEIRRIENNTFSDPTPEGQFTFSNLMTALLDANGNPVAAAPGTVNGYDFASFLLGLPSATNVRFGTPSKYFRSWGYVGYFTDDWRARPNFTLEYGVRYEAFTPPSELCGHISNLVLNPSLTQATVVVPASDSACSSLPSSSTGVLQSPALLHGDYNHWAPRIGIAWRPPLKALSGKHATTVRAGYGMFYNDSIYNQLTSELANQFPWANSQMLLSQACQPLTIASVPSSSCSSSSSSSSSSVVSNTYAINPDYRVGYAQIWNVSVETALLTNTTLSVTYTGTKGTHLDMLFAPNRPAPGSTSVTPQVANAGDFIYDTSGANSIYNALQVRLQRRAARGLGFSTIYTYGKSSDDASSIGGGAPVVVQNPADLRAEYGLSSFDVRQQLRANYFYELPFGDRHRFAQKGRSAALMGNWRLSGNITAQTGTPFTATVTGGANNTGGGGIFATRADQICNPNLPASERTPLHFFNTACFAAPLPGQFGDAARNTIQGPGSFTWNLQLAKWIPFGKDQNHRVDVRWEISNLTNTPNFTGLSTVAGASTFGRVLGASGMRTMDVMTRVNF